MLFPRKSFEPARVVFAMFRCIGHYFLNCGLDIEDAIRCLPSISEQEISGKIDVDHAALDKHPPELAPNPTVADVLLPPVRYSATNKPIGGVEGVSSPIGLAANDAASRSENSYHFRYHVLRVSDVLQRAVYANGVRTAGFAWNRRSICQRKAKRHVISCVNFERAFDQLFAVIDTDRQARWTDNLRH